MTSATRRPSPPPVTRPFLPPLAATNWTLDASASTVEFSVRQFWGLSTVHGRFARFEGELELGADGAGRAELRIEAASIDTGNRRRDRHLRAPDYFDCDGHALVRFVAAVVAAPGGGLRFTGELEAAGRAIGLDLVATVEGGGDPLELTAGAHVDARELGMTWSPVGNLRTPVTLAVRACLRRAA
jgi:polyisoprenoid-binding protein YceI